MDDVEDEGLANQVQKPYQRGALTQFVYGIPVVSFRNVLDSLM